MKKNISHYIVLRDKNNTLLGWRGFSDIETATATFISLGWYFNTISEGEWVFAYKMNAFTNGKEYITIVESSADLLMEILFDNPTLSEDMFRTFFSEKKEFGTDFE